jgi:hypothetical protein
MADNSKVQGTIKFSAQIVDEKGLTFPLFEFSPNEPGVDKVEIEAPTDGEIKCTVHLSGVDNYEQAEAISTNIHLAVLDRISFYYGISIEDGRLTVVDIRPIDPAEGSVIIPMVGHSGIKGAPAKLVHGLTEASLKPKLEQIAPPGGRSFSLFRSALLSKSPVERFMHLYNILLMFFNDDEPGAAGRLDNFVRTENPGVPQTAHPKFPGVSETVYTRLRNELGHPRRGVNLDQTKAEMKTRLGELIALTKRAIELNS